MVNLRIPLFAAVGLILGIYACYCAIFGSWYVALVMGLLLAVGIALALIFKNSAYKAFVILLVCAVVGFGRTQLQLSVLSARTYCEQHVTVGGYVSDIGRNGNQESNVYYLQDCYDAVSGDKLAGRIKLLYYGEDELSVGDRVMMGGTMSSVYPVKSDVGTYYLRNSVRYELHDVTVLEIAHGDPDLGERIRGYIYDVACEYMPHSDGVLYTLLTGDRNAMSDINARAFTDAGIIHIFAVSGLHVGFIVGVICFLLRRLRLHPALECIIVAVPLMLYAYICNFSPSVMRAFVMLLCAYAARILLGKADMLSSMSVAATILLLVQPFYIFDAGFQLSFLSVFGIATLYAPLNRRLARTKCNKAVRILLNSLLLSLCCWLSTLFTVAANFGVVPTLSALVNVIAIPIVSVAFVLGALGLIPWIFRYLLVASDYLLYALIKSAFAVSSLDFATVTFSVFGLSVVFTVIAAFVLGGYVNIGNRLRCAVCAACAVIVGLCVLLSALPVSADNSVYVAMSYGKTAVVAVSDGGEAALIADFDSAAAVDDAINYAERYRITDCTLYIPHYGAADPDLIAQALDRLPVTKAYKLNLQGNDEVDQALLSADIPTVYQIKNSVVGNDIAVRSLYDGAQSAVCVSVRNIEVCIVLGDIAAQNNLLSYKPDCDVYVLDGANAAYSAAGKVTLSQYQSEQPLNYGANKYGNFTIRQKGGKIILSCK